MKNLEEINGRMLKELIFEMKPGKTCSNDFIMAEMLYQLDEDILEELAKTFTLRLLNHHSENGDHTWQQNFINLVKKKANAIHVKDFRPIAIIPVVQKLFPRCYLG